MKKLVSLDIFQGFILNDMKFIKVSPIGEMRSYCLDDRQIWNSKYQDQEVEPFNFFVVEPYSSANWELLKAEIDSEIKKNIAVAPFCKSFAMPNVEFKPRSNTVVAMFVNLRPLDTFWYEGSAYIKLSDHTAYREENGEINKFGPHNEVRKFDSKITIEEL